MTKRLLSVVVAVLMVMALIPMSVFAANADSTKAGTTVAQSNKTAKPVASRTAAVTFDFEYASEYEFDWTLIDSDGDGYDWYWLGYGVNQTTANMAFEGIGNLTSASYQSVALTPDNWAITPAVQVPEDATTLTFYIGGQDPSWALEHYAVYAGTTASVGDMEVIMPEAVATGEYVQQTIDISDYAGETVYFGFRHFNVTDMFRINLDLVEIHSESDPADPDPTPAPTTAPVTPPGEGNATVILNVPEDHWQDGSGYQMLLDADATAFGTIIPETGALTSGGDVPDSVYAEFEYKIPVNADGALTTSNIVSCTSVSIEIPAGTYDWCITNPTPGDRMWIASAQGNVGGRQDDYQFVAGNTYEFVVTLQGSNDAVNVTITQGTQPQPGESDQPGTVGESIIWDFETEESLEGWSVVDADGDGDAWSWMTDWADYAHGGQGIISSASYDNDIGVLYPDNWAITPGVEISDLSKATFSFWYAAQDASYANEHFAVYAGNSDDIDEMVQILEETIVQAKECGTYREIVIDNLDEFDLNAGTVYFAIRHYNCTDMFRLNVDDAQVVIEGSGEPGPVIPEPINDGVHINEIRVYGFEAPVQFEAAGDHLNLTVPEDAIYHIEEAYWWNDTVWNRLVDDDTFDPAYQYSVVVKIAANEDCVIEQKVRFFADDSTETIDWDYTGRESETVAWLVVLPLDPVMSDLDRALNVEGGTIHFTTGGAYPWYTVEEGGRFYARSGNAAVSSSSSTVTATVEAAEGDIVMFDFKAWGEGSYTYWDECSFAIDNTVVLSYGAYDNDWETFMYALTAGTHELRWTYTKDSTVNPTGDYFAVDEVYVGEPIPVESITASITNPVPVNRSRQITWTVLPEKAFNKEVTFVSDDPTIATVDANGLVFGVAEGETFVTVTSVENPSIYAVVEIEVVDLGYFLSNIYGIAAYDPTEANSDEWIAFSNGNPAIVQGVGSAPDSYAAAYADGTIYGVTTAGEFYTADFAPDAIGPAQIIASGLTDKTVVSITFDYSHGALFGIAVDDNGTAYLVGINKENGMFYELMELPFTAINIAADDNGYAYMINFDSGELMKIDLESYEITTVGSTGYPVSYVQDMCYDFDHNCLFWAQYYDEGTLLQIDPDTAEVVEVCGLIGEAGIETCGMFVLPEVEPEINEGPFEVEDIEIIPEEIEIFVGQTYQFNVRVTPFYANGVVEWDVDDENIISVDQDGVVEGLKLGTASVYATCNDSTAFAIVNVINPPIMGWYFETDPEAEGWQFVDSDDDGFTWGWNYGTDYAYEGVGMIDSESYINYYGALTPDNWAISPAFEVPAMNGKVSLYAEGQDPDYAAEHFAIYVGTTPEIEDMTMISSEFVATGEYVKYEASLEDYAGLTVYIAIRHFNVTDMFRLNVDQVEIWGKNMLWGDANGDGVVDTVDALLLMRWVMGIEELDEVNLYPWCDVNGDGVIDFTDALLIARKVLGIIEVFPVEVEEP